MNDPRMLLDPLTAASTSCGPRGKVGETHGGGVGEVPLRLRQMTLLVLGSPSFGEPEKVRGGGAGASAGVYKNFEEADRSSQHDQIISDSSLQARD